MFTILSKDGRARTGILDSGRHKIKTPFFMPVATRGASKFVDFIEMDEMGTDCIISNSLLLHQRPGSDIIKKLGGLHEFYNWKGGIFTDSGGFQSLDDYFMQKSDDKGAHFKSPYDGKVELITPEKAMDIQIALAPDVAMCLDDVPKHDDDDKTRMAKTERTHAWAARCKSHHDKHKDRQLLFGIAQGGMDKDLRKKSIEYMKTLDFDGLALGGLAIGETVSTMYDMIEATMEHMPEDKPRYLMGVGNPADLIHAVSVGVDCFDSTFPTQNARHATIFTWKGKLRLDRVENRTDMAPLDEECGCKVCRNFSKAYIHQLLRVKEPTGMKLATYHNVYFMQKLMERIRLEIENGTFEEWKKEMINRFMQ